MADHQQSYSPAPQYQQQQPPQQQYYQQTPQDNKQQSSSQQYHQQQQPPQQQYSQQHQVQQYQQPPPMQHHPSSQQQVQQYQPQQQMHPQNHGGQVPMTGDWHNSLMDCSPCESCFLGCCCPCILLGKTSVRIGDPTMQTYETINADCGVMAAISTLTCCGWVYVMLKRTEIRERYGIKGDGIGDCCTAYWCACCALIQQDKEVQARTAHLAGGPVTQAYQPPKEGMVMPGQQPQHQIPQHQIPQHQIPQHQIPQHQVPQQQHMPQQQQQYPQH